MAGKKHAVASLDFHCTTLPYKPLHTITSRLLYIRGCGGDHDRTLDYQGLQGSQGDLAGVAKGIGEGGYMYRIAAPTLLPPVAQRGELRQQSHSVAGERAAQPAQGTRAAAHGEHLDDIP